jgi:HSP20 family protein
MGLARCLQFGDAKCVTFAGQRSTERRTLPDRGCVSGGFVMQWNSLLNPASSPFVALRRDMERHLGRDVESTFAGMSVIEHEDRWTVAVDVPGLAEGDVNITVQDGLLVIEGERQLPVPENARAVFNDRSAGKFRRSLRLREGVDVNSIDASLQLGVLTLTLQKTAEAGAKKIAIRSGQ